MIPKIPKPEAESEFREFAKTHNFKTIDDLLGYMMNELNKELEGKLGQQVLVIEEEERPLRYYCMPPPGGREEPTMTETTLNLGILSGAPQIVKNQYDLNNLVIPTEKYVCGEYGFPDVRWKLQQGQMPLINRLFMKFNDILVGEEVGKYFEKHHMQYAYGIGLKMLGAEIPDKIKPKYEAEFNERQLKIVTEIETNERKARSLETRIKEVMNGVEVRPMKGGQIMFSTQPEVPGYDKTDAMFMTWGERDKLKEAYQKINHLLYKAAELGMHDGEKRTIELEPGKLIELPRFITAKMQYYEISLEPAKS